MCVWITFFCQLILLFNLFLLLFMAPLHFWYYLWVPLLGVSMGWSGSGLCQTRNRPAHIGWKAEQSVADCRQPQVKSNRSPMDNDRVGRSQSEFQPPDLRWIFAEFVDFSSKSVLQPQD